MPRRSASPTPSSVSSSSSYSLTTASLSASSSSHKSLLSSLPAIPDLRFEQSYLATIRSFLHETDKEEALQQKLHEQEVKNGPDYAKPRKVQKTRGEGETELWLGALRVEWVPLLYVTVRDQVFSPLIQGVTWGLGTLLLGKFSAFVRDGLQSSRQYRNWQRSQANGSGASQPGRQRGGSKSLLEALGLTDIRRQS
ncbi:hypothetical protein ACQY0O_000465 [Thecaphora frezii]